MNTPLISIIMPVYNEEKHVSEAINSILNQTFKKFELIIIDDGSTDKTVEIIKNYNDERITLISLSENKGNRYAANVGIKAARAEYIVRQDGDDISLPYRLEKQYHFMEENPTIGFSGGGIQYFGEISYTQYFPEVQEEIQVRFLFGTSICQGTSIIRKEIIEKYNITYQENGVSYAEDFDLFYRLSLVANGANLSDILIKYRRHDANVSKTEVNYSISRDIFRKIIKDYLEFSPSEEELEIHELFIGIQKKVIETTDMLKVKKWLEKISRANQKTQKMNQLILDGELIWRWKSFYYRIYNRNKRLSTLIRYCFIGRRFYFQHFIYFLKKRFR